jgi:hypothetical protein
MRLRGVRLFTTRLMRVAPVVLAAFLGFSYWRFQRSHERHDQWCRDIEDHIVMLADKRPEGVTAGQWAHCLSWTSQLHGNCGGYAYFDHSNRTEFLAEFDRRLAGPVDLGTIDWIWDEYVAHSTCGRDYARNHRPTDPERLRDASADNLGDDHLREWLDRLSRLPPRKIGTTPKAARAAPKAVTD